MGRPSSYTQELADEIVTRLSAGEPLAQICRDPHMPSDWTVRQWADANRPFMDTDGTEISFAIAYGRAREAGFDAIALDTLHIADDNGQDTRFVGAEGEEREVANTEWISRSKLRVETRLKLLAKWHPKVWGEKVVVGGDPENPIGHKHAVQLSDEALAAIALSRG